MSISVRDRKLLWGRAGNQCSFEKCSRELIIEVEETGQDVVVSNEAHIVSREDGGPRANPSMPMSERDSYPNLILLCLEHHTVVDSDETHWTVNRLHEMKSAHEASVSERMTAGETRSLQLDVAYATIVSDWAKSLEDWSSNFDSLLAPTPHISYEGKAALDETRARLLNRIWPGTRPDLEHSFRTLRLVMDDLAMLVDCWLRDWGGAFWHRPLYKDQMVPNYDELADRALWIVDLIHDLVFEMTRAANQVILEVSLDLDPAFRRAEGFLTIDRQGSGLYFEKHVPRYQPDEYQPDIYAGIRDFATARGSRSVYFGSSLDEEGLRDVTPISIPGD